MVRGGMTGYCRGGFRMDALMSVKLISLLSPKGLREGKIMCKFEDCLVFLANGEEGKQYCGAGSPGR